MKFRGRNAHPVTPGGLSYVAGGTACQATTIMPEYRRRLRHFHRDDAYLFLTWRLWGSLPRKLAPSLQVGWQAKPPAPPKLYPTPGHAFVAAPCGWASPALPR